MNIILLSGGSGKRLWPLSNEVRSKQFLKILRTADGGRESMAQRMYRMIREVNPGASVTIATSASQVPQIRSQLGEDIGISVEPCRRDTFPAIALACAYLHDRRGTRADEAVVVCPVDPYVGEGYFKCLQALSAEAERGNASLTLMGIEPDYPSEKYGYILPEEPDAQVSRVRAFKEKPDLETTEGYIRQGALWNGGVFAFRLSYLLGKSRELLGVSSYDALLEAYDKLEKISFDYAVAEKERSISVIRYAGTWEDLGSWNTLTGAMQDAVSGNAVLDKSENTHVVNELGIPMVVLGIDNAVVAATPDGILVSDKHQSSQLKDYVGESRPMYERRGWGEYRVLDCKIHQDGQNSLTKELVIFPGQHISYQRHRRRTEIWAFTEGTGELVLDGAVKMVTRGDIATITPGTRHGIKAVNGDLHIIEVQIGDKLTEDDIERFDWDWG